MVEKTHTLLKRAVCICAVALSFVLYVLAFEPFAAAEFAYIFAVPALFAARALGLADEKVFPKNLIGSSEIESQKKQYAEEKKSARKIYFGACFVFSYLAWTGILVWLRHVYPPAGWAAMLLLPLVISTLFIFPWFCVAPAFLPKLSDGIFERLLKLAGLAGLWVVLEWVRSWIFTGFPWLLLGDSQWLRTPIIQSAEFGGVWIVSFTVIFFNLAIEEYFFRLYAYQKFKLRNKFAQKPPFGKFSAEFYLALVLVFSGVWIYISEFPSRANEYGKFRAGLVQPDFAGILKWRDELAKENFDVVKKLTLALKSIGADVVLLPEAATPPRYPVVGAEWVKKWFENLAKELNAPIIFGNMAYVQTENACYNGTFSVSPKNGLAKEFYAKSHLVPFGEYVPMWAKWLGKVVPVGNMSEGKFFAPLNVEINKNHLKIGNMICYEDIFPDLARDAVKRGADILFVCTNDSWYGREAGAWQHASHAALQAVSTRKPLMRSSNNGLSCVFDQYGRMRPTVTLKNANGTAWRADSPAPAKTFEIADARGRQLDIQTLKPLRSSPLLDENNSIYFRGAGFADVVFYKNFDGKQTFYTRWGNWFVWLCALLAAAATALILYRRKKMSKIIGKKA